MDETTKAPTLLCTIVTDRGVSWQQALEMLEPAVGPVQNGVVDLEAPITNGGSQKWTTLLSVVPATGPQLLPSLFLQCLVGPSFCTPRCGTGLKILKHESMLFMLFV